MAIPDSQLEVWSHQGAITTAKATHEAVRRAFDASEALRGRKFEAYLQGSYRNDTNVRGNSDVDLVVEHESAFYYDTTLLSATEVTAFHEVNPSSPYNWTAFRADVLAALRLHFGPTEVEEGNRCLKVKPGNGRLPCDVLVCQTHHTYSSFSRVRTNDYVPGVTFWTKQENRQVVNYPKAHYANGVTKNSDTGMMFKPMVRILKSARSAAVDRGYIGNKSCASYFLENLIFNVPKECFASITYGGTFVEVVNWLNAADLTSFWCQNGKIPLFGPAPEQWSEISAQRTISAFIQLWNDWR